MDANLKQTFSDIRYFSRFKSSETKFGTPQNLILSKLPGEKIWYKTNLTFPTDTNIVCRYILFNICLFLCVCVCFTARVYIFLFLLLREYRSGILSSNRVHGTSVKLTTEYVPFIIPKKVPLWPNICLWPHPASLLYLKIRSIPYSSHQLHLY